MTSQNYGQDILERIRIFGKNQQKMSLKIHVN